MTPAPAQLAASDARPAASADQEDLRAACGGDGEAYARLVRRYQGEVAARMRRFTRRSADLEELVQEVFVEAYFSLPSFRGEAPLAHWLRRIGTRVGYRFWQRQRERPATLELQAADGATAPDPAARAGEAAEAAGRLHAIMAQLPPRDRLVLTLLYLEEHSVAEAARQTGWSQTMVKVQAFRARAKLKKLLEHLPQHQREGL